MKSTRPPRILVFASINLDLTLDLERLPRLGETVLAHDSFACPGGKGANQAVAARRLGAEVGIVCSVGDDLPGRAVRRAIEAEGIEIVGWHIDPDRPTGLASINVLPDGQNAIVVASGANRSLSPEHAAQALSEQGRWDAVLCTLESPLEVALAASKHTDAHTCPLMLDAGGHPETLHGKSLVFLNVLTANETEIETITGQSIEGHGDIGALLRDQWKSRCSEDTEILFKWGERGAILIGAGGSAHSDSISVKVIDTVAAGDAHSAAFAVARAEGRPAADALRFANAAGALACTQRGAFPAMPSRAEVDQLLKEQSAD